MRIILYTGKGGVGKTSIAAATGLRLAKRGYRTIIISTDPAHSLGDSFDRDLGPDPVEVAPNLWAHEIDVFRQMRLQWQTVQDWLVTLIQWQGMEGIEAEEMAVLPGMEELIGLLQITHHYREGDYDVVVVDCAPTAETLRLLSFPDMARWYMRKIFPIERRVVGALGPLARGLFNLPVPDGRVFDVIEDVFHQIEFMRQLLVDHAISSIRLVVNPEKMVVKEALRTYTYLSLYDYHTDLVVCNRMLPDSISDSFFDGWRAAQQRHLEYIHEAFSPIPIWTAPLMDREVVGLEALEELAHYLYGEADPAAILYQGPQQEIVPGESGYLMEIQVPFTSQEELSLLQRGEEVVVQAGKYRRHVFLPRMLAGMSVAQAKLDGSTLRLRFQEDGSQATREQGKGRKKRSRPR